MDTQTNKQLFIEALDKNIWDENQYKKMILELANTLIPDEDTWKHIDAAGSPIVQKAIRAYKKSHPKYKKIDPPIEVVMDWLLKRGGIRYAEAVEQKLEKIHEILMSIGEIEIDEHIFVHGMQVLTMRVLSDLNPTLED